MTGKAVILPVFAAILTGCGSCPTVSVDIPPKPQLITPPPSLVDEIERIIDPDGDHPEKEVVREWMGIQVHNDSAMKSYAKQLEARLEAINAER